MLDAALDSCALREVLASIKDGADYLTVTVHGPERRAGHVSIDEAFAALLSGEAVAVRLSYRIDENTWFDTLMRAPEGFRLLRVSRPGSGYVMPGE